MSRFEVITAAATTNLCTNPSVETDTTGWSAAGATTVARSTEQQFRGAYSLKVTLTAAASDGILYTITGLENGKKYYISAYVYVPTGWTTAAPTVSLVNFTAATTGTNVPWDGTYDKWVRVRDDVTIAADGSGLFRIIFGNPVNNDYFYIDGMQIEEATLTTYCDGDQEGCYWTTTPHSSTSKRYATSKAGGATNNFNDVYGFEEAQIVGAGMPPPRNVTIPLAILGGSQYRRTVDQDTNFVISGTLRGSTLDNLHSLRQGLINAFNARTGKDDQKTRIIYDDKLYLDVIYNDGLHFGRKDGFAENVSLSLQRDPYWVELAQQAALITTGSVALSVGRIMERDETETWGRMAGGISSASPTINAAVYDSNNRLWVGGDFSTAGAAVSVDDFAMWDGAAWTGPATATGGTGVIQALAEGTNGKIYIGGTFTNLNSVTNTSKIGTWDGSVFAAIAGGTTFTVTTINDFKWDAAGNMYICGNFSVIDNTAAGNIIKRTTAGAWAVLGAGGTGNGTNGEVHRMEIVNDTLYAFGAFTAVGDIGGSPVTANYAAKYSISGDSWTAFADEPGSAVLSSVKLPNQTIAIGGAFTTIGSDTHNRVAIWDNVNWQGMGNGFADGQVDTMASDPGGNVYAGGTFTTTGSSVLPDPMAVWTQGAWRAIDADTNANDVDVIAVSKTFKIAVASQDMTATEDVYIAKSTTVTSRATTKCYPVITINNADTTSYRQIYRIDNTTAGYRIFFDNLQIAPGEEIIIDLRPGQKTITSKQRSNYGYTSLVNAVLPGSDWNTFAILPNIVNTLAWYANDSADSDLTIKFVWDVLHPSIDGAQV